MSWTPAEAEARRGVLLDALKRHKGNVTVAASAVGVTRATFYAQAERLGLHTALGLPADPAKRDQQLPPDARTGRTVQVTEARW
jgi:hypothetical protein